MRPQRVSFSGVIAIIGLFAVAVCPPALADCPPPVLANSYSASLSGYDRVPPVSTSASGEFELWVESTDPLSLGYQLCYEGLAGDIRYALLNFAQPGVNGGIIAWLCDASGGSTPPTPTESCTSTEGTVTGSLSDEDILEVVFNLQSQGINLGEIDKVLDAIETGTTYVTVYSESFSLGEIRGNISKGDEGNNGDLEGRLSDLEEAFYTLVNTFMEHTHTYLTGKGEGHNNTEATTDVPTFGED